jgi:hypothetical protein
MGENETVVEPIVSPLQESILSTIKKLIGFEDDYTQFDMDLIMHINAAFASLAQIGSNLKEGFFITDKDNLWSEYTTNVTILESVKMYVYLKTKIVFDPPASSMVIETMKQTINELEFRIQISADSSGKEET